MTVHTSRAWVRGLIGSTAVLALVVPGTAVAQTLHHTDASHDVQKARGSKTVDAPDNATTDITRLTLAHTPHKVRVTMRLRDYRAGTWFYVEDIRTPDRTFEVQGSHHPHKTVFTISRGRKPVDCDGLTQALDAAHDTLVVTVPSSCLQDPTWVQIGVGLIRQAPGGTFTADDGLRTKGIVERNLTLSKRLTT